MGNNEFSFKNATSSIFLESDYFFDASLAIKSGLRYEYHALSDSHLLLPRITAAKKINKQSQLSISYGEYTQTIQDNFLFFDQRLGTEKATHVTSNFSFKTEKHIVRAEAFWKKYDNLLSFSGSEFTPSDLGNNGYGNAYGVDFFWRGNQVIKNTDFWISYSWTESSRRFRNYPVEAAPAFAARHNLSVVTKHWIESLRSQLGLTYSLASGRPYENPNTEGFLNERSSIYNNVSASWAYLISPQKILFVSVSNFPGFENEYGYRYGRERNMEGIYPSEQIRPSEDSFFFVGLFITFSGDKTKNQLDSL